MACSYYIHAIVLCLFAGEMTAYLNHTGGNSLLAKAGLRKPLLLSFVKAPAALNTVNAMNAVVADTPCTCGVFLTGQFSKGSQEPPNGSPALLHEHDAPFMCTQTGTKQCTNKCLEMIVKHLPNSQAILCATIDRDCHKERAYLFVQNCHANWINTNLSAGREYCCKDGVPYKCPLK